MEKFLTIIIPTYKRSEFLCRAIDSILKNSGDYEIIVVDDNDEDSTFRRDNEKNLEKYLKNNEIIYLKHKKNKNGAAARNTGIKKARGKYITFLDDDDEFYEDRIKEIYDITQIQEYDFIYTGVEKKYSTGEVENFIPKDVTDINFLVYELLLQKSFVGTGSNIVCKKELVDKIGGFDETFLRHQDIEFLIRYLSVCDSVKLIDKVLVRKNTEDHLNIPNIKKMVEIKEHFLEKFDILINSYSKQKKIEILKYNYNELLKKCYVFNEKNDLLFLRNIMKKNHCYSYLYEIKLKIQFFINKFKFYKLLKKFIKRGR